jgi:hypothetical protein
MPELCLQSLAFPYHRKRQNLERKTEGTCDWVRTHTQYLNWTKRGGSLLVSGRPGTGKSTLLYSMLEDSTIGSHSDRATFMASFFFHRRGDVLQYSPLGLFRSLLHQILTRDKILLAKFATDTKFEERCKSEGELGLGRNGTRQNRMCEIFSQSAYKRFCEIARFGCTSMDSTRVVRHTPAMSGTTSKSSSSRVEDGSTSASLAVLIQTSSSAPTTVSPSTIKIRETLPLIFRARSTRNKGGDLGQISKRFRTLSRLELAVSSSGLSLLQLTCSGFTGRAKMSLSPRSRRLQRSSVTCTKICSSPWSRRTKKMGHRHSRSFDG